MLTAGDLCSRAGGANSTENTSAAFTWCLVSGAVLSLAQAHSGVLPLDAHFQMLICTWCCCLPRDACALVPCTCVGQTVPSFHLKEIILIKFLYRKGRISFLLCLVLVLASNKQPWGQEQPDREAHSCTGAEQPEQTELHHKGTSL